MSRAVWVALLAVGLGCSTPPPQPKQSVPEDGGSNSSSESEPAKRDAPARTEPEPQRTSSDPKPTEPEVLNRSPKAQVEPSTVQATVGSPISLDASGSSDPDGSIVRYSWRVGNGTPTTGPDPSFSHTFHEAGLQTILLTVEDDRGATAVYVVQAVIKE